MDYKKLYEQMLEVNKKLHKKYKKHKTLAEGYKNAVENIQRTSEKLAEEYERELNDKFFEKLAEESELKNKKLKEENKKLKEEKEQLKEEMKWRLWGEGVKEGNKYDIENDADDWDSIISWCKFTEEEMKVLLKYFPRPEEYMSDTEEEE